MTTVFLVWAIVATAIMLALFSSLREAKAETVAWKRTADSHRERWGKAVVERDGWRTKAVRIAEGNVKMIADIQANFAKLTACIDALGRRDADD